ncbi:MAG: TRAP transporter large permease subunit, partial [Mesorhizobium sp.]
PGLFIALAFMVFNHVHAVRHGYNPPSPMDFRKIAITGVNAILPMLTPVILLVGIVDGYFTPTEAAAIAALYTLFLAVILYRTILLTELPGIIVDTARTSGTILFIAATAKLAAWVFTYDGLPQQVATLLGAISTGPTMVLILVFLFLIVVGMFMDAIAAMFILIPVLLPPAVSLGVDPM